MSQATKNQFPINNETCFDLEYFEKKKTEIIQYYQNKNGGKTQLFVFHRVELVETLLRKVEDNGLIFIESPMLKGKTMLLKSIKEYIKKKEYVFLFDIIEEDDYLGNKSIESVLQLYIKWTQTILSNVYDNYVKDKRTKNSKALNKFYTSTDRIEKELKHKFDNNDLNYFEAFLETIKYYIKKTVESKLSVYFIIRLDDFNSYINKTVYKKFENDLRQLLEDGIPYDASSDIKLIVSTRIFPSQRPNRIVFYINNFSIKETEEYIKLSLEINDDCKYNLYNEVYSKTNGHPWFVNRFIQLFIIKYIDIKEKLKEEKQFNEFVNNIFKEKENWTKNVVFKTTQSSDFFKKIEDKIDNCKTDSLIKSFLNIEKERKNDKKLLQTYKDNLLIKEMGLINFKYNNDYDTINISSNCNTIMENIFIDELKRMLTES